MFIINLLLAFTICVVIAHLYTKNVFDDLNGILDEDIDSEEMFFEILNYMNGASKSRLFAVYLFSFVRTGGKDIRKCFLPMKLCIKFLVVILIKKIKCFLNL